MKITVVQVVKPSDGSPSLPLGEYEVKDVRSLGGTQDQFIATFVITKGPLRSVHRRISVIARDAEVSKLFPWE